MNLTSMWDVISSLDFDYDYLYLDRPPYVGLQQEGNRVECEYRLHLQVEGLVGWLAGDARAMLSFQGVDEMDAVDHAETITLKGECLILKLMCHNGDDFTFECEHRR